MVDVVAEFYELKRVVAHLDLALKAYSAASRDDIDAKRLLSSVDEELSKLIGTAEEAKKKVREGLNGSI